MQKVSKAEEKNVLATGYAVPKATITSGIPQGNTIPRKWVKSSVKGVLETQQLPRTGHILLYANLARNPSLSRQKFYVDELAQRWQGLFWDCGNKPALLLSLCSPVVLACIPTI